MEGNLFCKVLRDAQETKTAVAAINILNHITTRAVVRAAENAYRPVIVQPSVITVRRYGVEEMYRTIEMVRQKACVPVVLHLDHCKDEDLARACVRAGWDAVMMDFSALPLKENVEKTRRMVDYAHLYGVAVEGEIGIIAGVEDDISHEVSSLASLAETQDFIQRTGVDAIAPAIGTAHGVYTGTPNLNFTLVEQVGYNYVPLVVHGGTGLPEEDFLRLIALGAAKINISTALKQAYLGAARDALAGPSLSPIAFDQAVEDACTGQMEAFIRLFAREAVTLG